ncbi:MAG: hypothetical protein DI616_16820 [Paracoccus denitrificans]|uniref:Uncharacterized protein n=1 Tax=Paracoccus denitrificans TaxID=266 RepID=A0A533I1V9_PARDE|nr:MAG: hypothetical protein DI616_16820 [Paracoccus denitrificans]
MTQTLYATLRNNDEPIALPCFRIGFVFNGMLAEAANRDTAVQMLTLLQNRFANELAFMVLGGPTGKPRKLIGFCDKRSQGWLGLIQEGMPKTAVCACTGLIRIRLACRFSLLLA